MISTQGKFLMSAFVVIIIGIVLIQSVGTDVELVKIGSNTVTNESVTLTLTTTDITNESATLSAANTTTLANNHLTTLTALRNESSEDITGFCNISLGNAFLSCNATGSTTCYADYTYKDYSTGALVNDELNSFDACRNSSMTAITINTYCNATLTTGAVRVDYDNFSDNLAYIDYKYEPDTYVHSSAARTLLTLTVLFFAIGILTVAILFTRKALKDGGVL